eukprot:3874932-Heterocapsa_arctica.AAC.1
MNERPDPADETPKGGSCHVGKMIFSVGDNWLAIAVYVPEKKQHERDWAGWLKRVLGFVTYCRVVVQDREVRILQIRRDVGGSVFLNKG